MLFYSSLFDRTNVFGTRNTIKRTKRVDLIFNDISNSSFYFRTIGRHRFSLDKPYSTSKTRVPSSSRGNRRDKPRVFPTRTSRPESHCDQICVRSVRFRCFSRPIFFALGYLNRACTYEPTSFRFVYLPHVYRRLFFFQGRPTFSTSLAHQTLRPVRPRYQRTAQGLSTLCPTRPDHHWFIHHSPNTFTETRL